MPVCPVLGHMHDASAAIAQSLTTPTHIDSVLRCDLIQPRIAAAAAASPLHGRRRCGLRHALPLVDNERVTIVDHDS